MFGEENIYYCEQMNIMKVQLPWPICQNWTEMMKGISKTEVKWL
jgi:hypothetical protein